MSILATLAMYGGIAFVVTFAVSTAVGLAQRLKNKKNAEKPPDDEADQQKGE